LEDSSKIQFYISVAGKLHPVAGGISTKWLDGF